MIENFRKKIIKIFPVLAIILLAALVLSRVFRPDPGQSPQIRIMAYEAGEHIDRFAKVCGYVASANFVPDIGGQPTFINFEKPHPDQVFTVVIWGEFRQRWPAPPEELYANRNICVTGRIRMHNNIPQIIVENPDYISVS